jgi:hypothetical protein
MMNSLVKIGLALLLPVAAVVAVVVASNQPGQIDSRQRVVQAYVQYRDKALSKSLVVGEYIHARLPQNFQAALSKLSYSDTPYYQTTQRTNTNYPGQIPLPYPPNDVWCVKLSSADPAAPTAILVALHQDIYNADWVVHEMTDPATVLSAVGCKFSVQ